MERQCKLPQLYCNGHNSTSKSCWGTVAWKSYWSWLSWTEPAATCWGSYCWSLVCKSFVQHQQNKSTWYKESSTNKQQFLQWCDTSVQILIIGLRAQKWRWESIIEHQLVSSSIQQWTLGTQIYANQGGEIIFLLAPIKNRKKQLLCVMMNKKLQQIETADHITMRNLPCWTGNEQYAWLIFVYIKKNCPFWGNHVFEKNRWNLLPLIVKNALTRPSSSTPYGIIFCIFLIVWLQILFELMTFHSKCCHLSSPIAAKWHLSAKVALHASSSMWKVTVMFGVQHSMETKDTCDSTFHITTVDHSAVQTDR